MLVKIITCGICGIYTTDFKFYVNKRMAYRIILTLLLFKISLAQRPCCPEGDNILVDKKCGQQATSIALSCSRKYITSKGDDVTTDKDENLIIADARIPPDRYCSTKLNDTDVFLVCFSEDILNSNSVFTVYAILEFISVFFIIVTIFVYSQVTELLDLQGTCILHSISGLGLSFLTLAINQLTPSQWEKTMCVGIAYITYFTMLYAFFWLNVLAFHIWRTIVKPGIFKIKKYWPLIYHIYGCGGPIMLLVILVIAHSMRINSDINPGLGETKCWFKSTKAQFIYFYGPMAVLLGLNVIFYGWTITVLWRRVKDSEEKKTKILKYRLLLCVKLFFIMGISWIFELLSAAFQENSVLMFVWYATDAVNTLQGILIFLILVVFRKRVVRGLADRNLCGIRFPGRWRAAADDECDEFEEELNLSETQVQKQ